MQRTAGIPSKACPLLTTPTSSRRDPHLGQRQALEHAPQDALCIRARLARLVRAPQRLQRKLQPTMLQALDGHARMEICTLRTTPQDLPHTCVPARCDLSAPFII